jgi:hypothetical protein
VADSKILQRILRNVPLIAILEGRSLNIVPSYYTIYTVPLTIHQNVSQFVVVVSLEGKKTADINRSVVIIIIFVATDVL